MEQPPTRVVRASTVGRRNLIVEFIQSFHRDNGYSPSFREIAEGIGLGLSSTSYHIAQLQKAGVLVCERGKPRSLRVVEVHSREPL